MHLHRFTVLCACTWMVCGGRNCRPDERKGQSRQMEMGKGARNKSPGNRRTAGLVIFIRRVHIFYLSQSFSLVSVLVLLGLLVLLVVVM